MGGKKQQANKCVRYVVEVFMLILFWKGICKYNTRGRGGEGEKEEDEEEETTKGSWNRGWLLPLSSLLPLLLPWGPSPSVILSVRRQSAQRRRTWRARARSALAAPQLYLLSRPLLNDPLSFCECSECHSASVFTVRWRRKFYEGVFVDCRMEDARLQHIFDSYYYHRYYCFFYFPSHNPPHPHLGDISTPSLSSSLAKQVVFILRPRSQSLYCLSSQFLPDCWLKVSCIRQQVTQSSAPPTGDYALSHQ